VNVSITTPANAAPATPMRDASLPLTRRPSAANSLPPDEQLIEGALADWTAIFNGNYLE
jgi:hypothetical protein